MSRKTIFLIFIGFILGSGVWFFLSRDFVLEIKTGKSDLILDMNLEKQEKSETEQDNFYETILFSGAKDALLQNWWAVKEAKWKIMLNNVFWKESIAFQSR